MKKIFSFSFGVCLMLRCINSPCAAKTVREESAGINNERHLNIGLEAGFNTSTLRGNDTLSNYTQLITDFVGILLFQYSLSRNFSVQTGVTYIQIGTEFRIPLRSTSGNITGTSFGWERFNYLTLPLLFKHERGNRFKYFIYGGAYYAFLLKQEQQLDRGSINYPGNEEKKDFKKSDAGVSAGLGISYTTKKLLIFALDVRNNFGLMDISTSSSHLGGDVRTYSTNFLLAIYFPISK